ncbi:hypothetical protein COCSUDRAFT_59818 [Coccomyxa subellipsoidea C-169]|uniref:Uncharacterized protein n=1 Tax=Coccomyxa subellipsoidea (strain C-169) TaxID=574566 RepID=I0YKH2_COCSC|nr:hypothetical protein COCSUDRAFT_59818 [Coccomyxa subellipsoidea C-169]EIE18891.1 hypothetical protein COCSUDRAFT_59818 [Coccomyxa subellipsoidea C-169]|eukprot:XP_005643435.1 hypothetical protein COCSUDRAFT_59818 [Coccomyxa subellipsoidea C-169]
MHEGMKLDREGKQLHYGLLRTIRDQRILGEEIIKKLQRRGKVSPYTLRVNRALATHITKEDEGQQHSPSLRALGVTVAESEGCAHVLVDGDAFFEMLQEERTVIREAKEDIEKWQKDTMEPPEELLKTKVMAGGAKHGGGTKDSAEIKDLGVLVDSLEPPKDIQASMEAVRALKRELQAFRGGFTGGPLSLRTFMEKQDKLRALEEQVTKRLLQQTKVLRAIMACTAGGTYED